MRLTFAVLLTASMCLAFSIEASAKIPPPTHRPTFRQARDVMHTVLDTYALGTDGRLTLGGCRRHATMWIICRARIDYKHGVTRYRFQISRNRLGYLIGTNIKTIPGR